MFDFEDNPFPAFLRYFYIFGYAWYQKNWNKKIYEEIFHP